MNKVLWCCWFQGRQHAPWLVQKCLTSWEMRNPGWELRCLDQNSLRRYIDLPDLSNRQITYASLSDIARIQLLNEYGGIWVDATLLCHRPLDEWLPAWFAQKFFAFDRPGGDRPLASWFLAAGEHHYLIERWCASTLDYWARRDRADEYFWFHRLFRDLCETDPLFGRIWRDVPKVSADGPHAIQRVGLFETDREAIARAVDWRTPVFKLTHRFDESRAVPGTLLWNALEAVPSRVTARASEASVAHSPTDRQSEASVVNSAATVPAPPAQAETRTIFASLKVSTQNMGDHIQILAGLGLLRRLGIEPSLYIDRDDEIAACDAFPDNGTRVAMLLNGWFKTNRQQWPPNECIDPLFLGFHIRLFQCPELMSEAALDYYRSHGPIGCRDAYTQQLLAANDVESFESNCLTLTLPRRGTHASQREIFVVSRDRRLLDVVPAHVGPYTYINHYSETTDFQSNLASAEEFLNMYRMRAKLIITTFLHCALPAIGMGIPVVVFYPCNDEKGQQSDRERFSAIEKLTKVYRFDEAAEADWDPRPVDVSRLKLRILDTFYAMATRWPLPEVLPMGPIAPSSALPPT